MQTVIERSVPTQLAEADITPRGRVFPSPEDWRDQILYSLLPDRFSDGLENQRPLFDPAHPDQFQATDPSAWRESGKRFQGGTLRGIASKLDYLRDMGVTALWLGPIFRQRTDMETYHGFAIQNFLDVDPHFGTRQDLRDLVDAAHDRGLYILLHVIINFTGDNWFYRDETGNPMTSMPYRFSPPHAFHSWRSAHGMPTTTIQSLDDGIWPVEFQNIDWYTRAGYIGHWEPDAWEDPLNPDIEFRRGDFFSMKRLNLSRNDVLNAMMRVYQYWIAISDCDGFCLNLVKYLTWSDTLAFCNSIHEYTEMIGKNNFLVAAQFL